MVRCGPRLVGCACWSVSVLCCCAGHHPTLHQHFIKSKKVLDHHQVSIFQYCNIPAAGIKTFFNYLSLYLLYTMHLMYSIDPKTGKRLYTLKKVAPDGTASTSAHPGTSITLFVFYVNFFLFFFLNGTTFNVNIFLTYSPHFLFLVNQII